MNIKSMVILPLLTGVSPAFAHEGNIHHSDVAMHQFIDGIVHPFTGILHLALWLAVGVFIAQFSTKTAKRNAAIAVMVAVFGAMLLPVSLVNGAMLSPLLWGALLVISGAIWLRSESLNMASNMIGAIGFALLISSGFAHGSHLVSTYFATGFVIGAGALLLMGIRIGKLIDVRKLSYALGLGGLFVTPFVG
ncbi:HupE/UreJ family protein [Grimontia sp. NTOU-MAR1]|uniref:HupE/UreJ family protein n=1 Tax=Grimontia sp. NTOU-MAR1 TaxID=3111011 RepID=UPI002DBDAC1B|nr:HupE/UreJ family protein [Grimontia sp. NTOU-MAR1]WRV99943.1 HupE/UreJ family protein [Grimontia sp. NTOU-MAR1]